MQPLSLSAAGAPSPDFTNSSVSLEPSPVDLKTRIIYLFK
jgi:hypothetical protein